MEDVRQKLMCDGGLVRWGLQVEMCGWRLGDEEGLGSASEEGRGWGGFFLWSRWRFVGGWSDGEAGGWEVEVG